MRRIEDGGIGWLAGTDGGDVLGAGAVANFARDSTNGSGRVDVIAYD